MKAVTLRRRDAAWVQVVVYPQFLYYGFSTDGGRTWWGHSSERGVSLGEFLERFEDDTPPHGIERPVSAMS